jgi:hypothetical protein
VASDGTIALVLPDPFLGTGTTVADYIPTWGTGEGSYVDPDAQKKAFDTDLSDLTNVSRPVRGIVAKPNTPAFVQVIGADGHVISVFNKLGNPMSLVHGGDSMYMSPRDLNVLEAGDGDKGRMDDYGRAGAEAGAHHTKSGVTPEGKPRSTAWTDWILQSVTEARTEKIQIVETFGDTYLYAFGEKPRSLQFQGLLMNTVDYNWRAVFWANWDKYFRATRLIEMNARMYIGFDDILVEGYPINAVAQQSSESPNALMFSFTFFVTNYINLSEHRNFKQARKYQIAQLRGGASRTLAGGGGKFLLTRMGGDRFSIIEKLGFQGADWVGSKVYDMAKKLPATSAGSQILKRLAIHSAFTVQETVNALSRGMLATIAGPANAVSFMNAFLKRQTQQTFAAAKDMLLIGAEGKYGFARPGEFNQWFGFIGSIVDRVDHSNWGGTSGFFTGKKNKKMDTGQRAIEILKMGGAGGLDRMVQAMAYHTFSPLMRDSGFNSFALAGSGVQMNPNDHPQYKYTKNYAHGAVFAKGIADDISVSFYLSGEHTQELTENAAYEARIAEAAG